MAENTDDPAWGGAGREYARRRRNRLRRDPESEAPQHELAWLQGEAGEQRVSSALDARVRGHGGAAALHDLVEPGRRANVDHVVIGPAGVTVIDTKAWSGEITVVDGVLRRNGRRQDRAVDALRQQVAELRAILVLAGRDDVCVEPALCLAAEGDRWASGALHVARGVHIGCVEAIADRALRPGPLAPLDIAGLQNLLISVFRVRRGGVRVGGEDVWATAAAPPPRHGRRRPTSVADARRSAPTRRRPRRRASGRRNKGFGSLFARLAAAAALVAFAPGISARMTRGFVDQESPAAKRAAWRTLATERAGGPVRGPRVLRRVGQTVLLYRRGGCVVRIALPAASGGARRAELAVTSAGCGRQA